MVSLKCGDCLELLKTVDSDSIDLVVTSPPYDDLRNYNNSLLWDFDTFTGVAKELYRVLADGGVIIWVVADRTVDGSETGTSFRQALYFKDLGLNIHDTMIYRKLNYVPLTHNRYEQEFEYMFCFSKGKPKTFNPIKVPCKYAGTETWGGSSFYKSDNDELTVVGKKCVNDEKIKGNIFEYRTGSLQNRDGIKHPAMFPINLATDQVLSWSNESDIVLDPFMGSGTTGVAAVRNGRSFIGFELVSKYFDIANARIQKEIDEVDSRLW